MSGRAGSGVSDLREMFSCSFRGSGMSGPRGMFSCCVGGGSGISGPRWMFSCEDGGCQDREGCFRVAVRVGRFLNRERCVSPMNTGTTLIYLTV